MQLECYLIVSMTSFKVLRKLLTTRSKKTKLNGSLMALACLASYCLGDGSLANQQEVQVQRY